MIVYIITQFEVLQIFAWFDYTQTKLQSWPQTRDRCKIPFHDIRLKFLYLWPYIEYNALYFCIWVQMYRIEVGFWLRQKGRSVTTIKCRWYLRLWMYSNDRFFGLCKQKCNTRRHFLKFLAARLTVLPTIRNFDFPNWFGVKIANWYYRIWKFHDIFQSLRFYVKLILGILEVQNLPF